MVGGDGPRGGPAGTVWQMSRRRSALILAGGLVALAGCSNADGAEAPTTTAAAVTAVARTGPTATTTTASELPTSSSAPTTMSETTTIPATTTIAPTTVPETTTTPAPTTVPETTTTTTLPPLNVYDPACVVQVVAGDSLTLITERIPDEIVTAETVGDENGLPDDTIHPGQLLDVCVGNGIDDITGAQRVEPNAAVQSIANQATVVTQQEKLNELFAPYTTSPLTVDGISGPVTRQRLCAFRLAMGLPVSTEDMVAGSEEEQWLMAMPFLPVPPTSARESERWILIDRTCQIMFVGAGFDQLAYVFPTSTGEPGFETRPQNRSRAFRYDPASDNAGWHESSIYPVPEDNPLNGNMYKPIYFDRGQAIHGALNVPRSPASKGCARLRVEHQDLLVTWLGLGDLTSPTGSSSRINVTVNVQGDFVPR